MQIRKWMLGVAAATAVLVPLSMSSVAQAATKVDVLTISKAKGTSVKAKANLTASLASKTKLSFSGSTGAVGATCTSSTITFKVTSNPAKPGIAKLDLTKEVTSKCTVTGSLATEVKSITISLDKSSTTTISDKKASHPVAVTNYTVKVVVDTTILPAPITCIYTAKSLVGTQSNKTNAISFSKQKLTLGSGSNSDCSAAGTTGTYSVTYGPLKDASVKGSPKVFVN